jgi:hypothetical protein
LLHNLLFPLLSLRRRYPRHSSINMLDLEGQCWGLLTELEVEIGTSSPVSARCFSSRSSFACTSWHRRRIPESVDELPSPYSRRSHSTLGGPSSIEVAFPVGRWLRLEWKSGRSERSKFSGF